MQTCFQNEDQEQGASCHSHAEMRRCCLARREDRLSIEAPQQPLRVSGGHVAHEAWMPRRPGNTGSNETQTPVDLEILLLLELGPGRFSWALGSLDSEV